MLGSLNGVGRGVKPIGHAFKVEEMAEEGNGDSNNPRSSGRNYGG